MEFFNDLSRRFSSVARGVSEKNRDGGEASRRSGELRAEQAALEQLYAELGRLCWDIHVGEAEESQAEGVLERIRQARERIEALTARQDAARQGRRCPACGTVMPREARFCYACGKRMPEDAPALDPESPPDAQYCEACGAARVRDEAFCGLCGRPFEPQPAREAPSGAGEICPVDINVEEPEAADAGDPE